MIALTSPKPIRRKGLAMRFAALVVAVSVLGAAPCTARPSELVWWRSPVIGKTGHRLRILIPRGWRIDPSKTQTRNKSAGFLVGYAIHPVDWRINPALTIHQREANDGDMSIAVVQSPDHEERWL